MIVRRLLSTVRGLLTRHRAERELDEELRFHVEMETQANIQAGMSASEARRVALRDLGGVQPTVESVRDEYAIWLDQVWQDVRFVSRQLRRTPCFVVIAAIVLALGFAITGATFSTINGWLSLGAAIPNAERLVVVSPITDGAANPLGYFRERSYTRLLRLRLTTVTDLFATKPFPALLSVSSVSVNVRVEAVTGSYFRAIGVPPLLGRALDPSDDRSGSPAAVVLGEYAWRRVFAGDPTVIGRSIRLSGIFCTVVGVMPAIVRGFTMPTSTTVDLWAPVAVARPLFAPSGKDVWGQVFGRMVEGVSFRQAEAEMRVAGFRFDPSDVEYGAALLPVERGVMSTAARVRLSTVGIGLVALSALVLLIACANLANLLLARSVGRSSEVATRLALGASSSQILRLQLIETGTVTALGGAAGFAIVFWMSRLVGRFSIQTGNGVLTGTLLVDNWMLVYFFVLIASTSVAIGILPAMRALRLDPVQVIASSGARGRTTGRFERKRTLLVASQVAASTVLLVVAGLFVRSALHASRYDSALDLPHLAMGHFNVRTEGRDEKWERNLQETLLAVVRAMPGVQRAALSTGLPAGGGGELVDIEAADAHLGSREFGPPCRCVSVSPGFFDVVGPLHVRGRDFTSGDSGGARGVAIVNDVAASRLWPGRDPIGQQLRIRKGHSLDVVGVVAETDRTAQDLTERCYTFVPMAQRYKPQFALAVTGTQPAASLLKPLTETVARAMPDAAMFDVTTAEALLNRAGGPLRAVALVLVAIGGLGLTIALVGLYGVMSYVVGLRRAEFGIREVLGATRAQIHRLVFADACRMLIIGILAGLPIAYAVSVLMARALVGVTSHDAVTYLLVSSCLLGGGLIAAWWPARRAARVEPAVALRDL